jgi:hypothetical protein
MTKIEYFVIRKETTDGVASVLLQETVVPAKFIVVGDDIHFSDNAKDAAERLYNERFRNMIEPSLFIGIPVDFEPTIKINL